MSDNWNRFFAADEKGYLKEHLMTAVGMRWLPPGPRQFDIHHEIVDGYKIARLDAWDSSSRNDDPLSGYWLPQGGSCLIPRVANRSIYVFTADFSGCAICVDQINAHQYRVYHIQGGQHHLQREYLKATRYSHGLGLAAVMTFTDYSVTHAPYKKGAPAGEQTRGCAFLKFENGRWWIYSQRQDGKGIAYNNGRYTLLGPQSVAGGARLPVADLTCEVSRFVDKQSDHTLPRPTRQSVYASAPAAAQLGAYTPARAKQAGVFSRMVPNEERW